MSRLVQRCQGDHCGRRVLGVTSFRTIRSGQRAVVCRLCTATAKRIAEAQARMLRTKLAPIENRIAALRMQLGKLERRKLEITIAVRQAS